MLATRSGVYRCPSRETDAPENVVEGEAVGMMHEKYEVTDRKTAYHWRMKG
jgi:hypothetical protein